MTLSNGRLTATFGERGLTEIAGRRLLRDDFSIVLDGHDYSSAALPTPSRKSDSSRVTYSYDAGSFRIDAAYELRDGWRFLSKQIVVTAAKTAKFRVDRIAVLDDALAQQPREVYAIGRKRPRYETGLYGAALRFGDQSGLLAVVQNPFLVFNGAESSFSVEYRPDMAWNSSWGPFASDRGLLAPYRLSGRFVPERMLPEWKLGPVDTTPGMDEAEVAAFTDMVRAFLLYHPKRPLNVMVGWCVNDYQIDIATKEGRAEYKRIMDTASALGADDVLFAPANSDVSSREETTDDWGWENVLWLGMGEKIRKNEWDPSSGTLPASTREMLDYARSKGLGLLAYVYPVLGFTQNPEWLTGPKHNRANLGDRVFQDWLIGALEGFYKHTGISGYSFDHTFLTYAGASRYAQWYGWRRVMETLRRDIPDIVIDGRQAYQNYGPWTWLAGSYPHPTSTDEQPESFVSFPDLKIDRVSADRERYTAYRYRNYEFAPSEIVPGFITHQTPRSADTGYMPEAKTRTGYTLLPFRRRDWDYLGWRYSLLSSMAIAGWNNVLDMIPARDPEEFKYFSETDKRWFRHWIDWANENKEYLRHTRTILGQPAIGKVDGTSAIVGDRGYVFLFNPDGRRLKATVALDESIGLERRGRYLVREIYPLAGRLIAGEKAVSMILDGGSAMALQIEPAPAVLREPMLVGAPGSVRIANGVLEITDVRGEMGTSVDLRVELPTGARVSSMRVNGNVVRYTRSGDVVSATVTFAGAPFRHYQQVDPNGTLRIPKRVFHQLAARRAAWPIPWTSEDERSTWLAPQRLLLYLQFAEPDDRWNVKLAIDGRDVDLLKAYASVRPVEHNFVGFYADISLLSADTDHRVHVQLPAGLDARRFLGAFVENVETEYTEEIVRGAR